MRLLLIASTFLVFQVGAQSLAKLGPLPSIEVLKEGELEASIKRGVDYLIGKQNKDGSWGGPTRTKGLNIYAPVPDSHLAFRTGASTLALSGLLDSGDRRPEVVAAIKKAEAWLFKKLPKLRHLDPTTTYNVWGHAYGLRAISDLYVYRTGDEAKLSRLKQLAAKQIEMLIKTEDINGGWGYLDFDNHTAHFSGIPTSFTTATVLLGMKDAEKTFGLLIPEREIKRGLVSINKQRTPDWSFVCSYDPDLGGVPALDGGARRALSAVAVGHALPGPIEKPRREAVHHARREALAAAPIQQREEWSRIARSEGAY